MGAAANIQISDTAYTKANLRNITFVIFEMGPTNGASAVEIENRFHFQLPEASCQDPKEGSGVI